ncbi:MAG: hypothetical protein WAK03_13540 [Methylocystis sp.]|jgi:hypothetical protein
MKNMRASVAIAVLASILTGSFAFAKNPAPAPVGKSSSPAATPPSSEPSDADRVKNWTKKEWNEAVKEWAQDKAKWEGCQKQSAAKKLSGRKSWSFLYGCMNE